jgi:MinD-like ATPase involved in chromosome partitioning or flagellar assembly/tetratricopeptide (TPR) repeat protein
MSLITTFYSYKGGVGRSMALANIAVLLSSRGLRVLVVDWDLEAPGLERFFSYFRIQPSSAGLLELLRTSETSGTCDALSNLSRVEGKLEERSFTFSLLPSGRETDVDYVSKLESFDWETFFARGGGAVIETMREQWLGAFDITLIDSRTGLSDACGVCTIQLPDILVALFTANYQSLYGVRDIIRLAIDARARLAYDRMQLSVLPLLSRFSSGTEFVESQEWIGRTAKTLSEFYADWLPTWLKPIQVVEALKIPQVDYFGFGEKLAVVEQGISDPQGMGYVYDKVAQLLMSGLQNVESVLNITPPPCNSRDVTVIAQTKSLKPVPADYEFDVYVSYSRQTVITEWLRGFVDELQGWLSDELGREAIICFETTEIIPADSLRERLKTQLLHSRVLLPIMSIEYLNSTMCLDEWITFELREQVNAEAAFIFPVWLRDSDRMPQWMYRKQSVEMPTLPLHASAFSDKVEARQLSRFVADVAANLAALIRSVPPFNPDWQFCKAEGSGSLWAYQKNLRISTDRSKRDPANTEWQRDLWVSYSNIGDVLKMQGNGPDALAAYQAGLVIAEGLAKQDSANTQWQRDLSVSHQRIGDVLVEQGDGPGALAAYKAGLAIREGLAKRDPVNTQWQSDLSVSNISIGDVLLVSQGDKPGALRAYKAGLAIREGLANRDPANTQWQRGLSVGQERIGDVLVAQGDLPGALAAYQAGLAIAEGLAKRDPANTQWQRDLFISQSKLADVLMAQGDGPSALKAYQAVLAINEGLAKRDPANMEWQRDLFVSNNNIGDVLVAQGDGPWALAAYQTGLAIAAGLAKRDPANTQWQRDLSVSHQRIGDVLVEQGDGPGALVAYQAGLAIAEGLAKRDPTNTEWQRDLSVSIIKIGDVLVAQGDGPGALAAYRAGLAMREGLAKRDPTNTEWQRDLFVSQSKLADVLMAQGDGP